jgi:hypothetical protein
MFSLPRFPGGPETQAGLGDRCIPLHKIIIINIPAHGNAAKLNLLYQNYPLEFNLIDNLYCQKEIR